MVFLHPIRNFFKYYESHFCQKQGLSITRNTFLLGSSAIFVIFKWSGQGSNLDPLRNDAYQRAMPAFLRL